LPSGKSARKTDFALLATITTIADVAGGTQYSIAFAGWQHQPHP